MRGLAQVIIKWVQALASPHEQMQGREELRYAYSKLHVWSLYQYRKVASMRDPWA